MSVQHTPVHLSLVVTKYWRAGVGTRKEGLTRLDHCVWTSVSLWIKDSLCREKIAPGNWLTLGLLARPPVCSQLDGNPRQGSNGEFLPLISEAPR